jgi:NAD+ diphosphatase
MPVEFNATGSPEPESSAPAYWFVVRGTELLIGIDDDGQRAIPLEIDLAASIASFEPMAIGTLDRRSVKTAEAATDFAPPEGFTFLPIRGLFETIDDSMYRLAGRAMQIVEWDRTHRICGRCGAETNRDADLLARTCPACGLVRFPRIDPSVLVLVERDGKALLARNETYSEGSFAVLAGFVDSGETLEEAVRREVREEVGIEVDDIRYFGSQPWPFPHGLMIAFTAQWVSGELDATPGEIAEAGWFAPDELPPLPGRMSIARDLVDDFIHRTRET